ncbi:MAG TPA: hypothetical protein VMZ28_07055 [Kofleriaceae bacterium]|nr:hypothetical protein [Kofleriaceae bacterium]
MIATRMMTVSLALAAAACGGGPRWPAAATAVVDSSFAGARRPVATVDVLPVDLQVWASPGTERNPEELSGALQVSVSGMVAAELASRGYQVTSQMDWDGTYVAPDGAVEHAMSEEQIAQTAYSLSGFGEAQRQVQGRILVPFLPVRLGGATGAEATLYVGGWAYAGKDRKGSSTAAKVAKGILIGVAIVAVVAIAIAARDGKAGEALGAVAEGTAKAASGAVQVAGRVLTGVAKVGLHAGKMVLRSGPDVLDASLEVADAFGHSHTHFDVYAARPDYYGSGAAPRSGRSAMQLEMTLVDNRTGRVLWHSRQRFPARPEKPKDVERAVGTLLAALPVAVPR